MSTNKLVMILIGVLFTIPTINIYTDGKTNAALQTHKAETVLTFNEIKERIVKREIDCESTKVQLSFMRDENDKDRATFLAVAKDIKDTVSDIQEDIFEFRSDMEDRFDERDETFFRHLGESE